MESEAKSLDAEFLQGLDWNALERAEALKNDFLVLDDLFDEAVPSKKVLAIVIASRHRNVHLMVLRHTLYQQSKTSKTIDLNVTQINLFNSPRDSEQIGILGRLLGERQTTIDANKRATVKLFGHLMFDLDKRSSKLLRYFLNCAGEGPSVFFCSTDKPNLNLENEFTKLLYS